MKEEKFKLTDPDAYQVCRALGENAFELYQIQRLRAGHHGCGVCHAVVRLAEVDAQSVCDCYGYGSLQEIEEEYGDSFGQILAECDFEIRCGNGECLITSPDGGLSWEQAACLIRRLLGDRV